MSRSTPPRPTYAYTTHTPMPPPNYYYEEQEGYVGDYTESDGLSEGSHLITANSNDIYRKKPAVTIPVVQPQEHYRQNMYIPANYYYEPVPTAIAPQMRRPAVPPPPPTYRRQVQMVDERARYYAPMPIDEGFRNAVVYSSPHIGPVRRPSPPPQTSNTVARPAVRRHPVTVRTPRYVRRTNAPHIFKKPSALCVPLACQIDPAVHRKTRKNMDEPNSQTYTQQSQLPLERRHSVPVQSVLTEGHPGPQTIYQKSVHMTQSDLDAVLARYETVFEDNTDNGDGLATDKCDTSSSKSSINTTKPSKRILATNTTNLKPKIPLSIKQKQSHMSKPSQRPTSTKTKVDSNTNMQHLEVEQITTDVLDSMLTELMNSGCKNKIGEHKQEQSKMEHMISNKSEQGDTMQRAVNANHKEDGSHFSKSFNYQDLSQNLPKSRPDSCQKYTTSNENIQKGDQSKLELPTTPRIEMPTASLSSTQQSSPCTHYPQTIDENGVMELHRSKSYIVNLIDRALSKELGTTTVDEKMSAIHKENEQLHARRAMGLVSKHFDKMDKGLCMEITQTLTDSLISNATAPPAEQETKQRETTCSCNFQDNQDEPLYIKQLRQLRWGHLRHIQREVRRLEDLERFLDSCAGGVLK